MWQEFVAGNIWIYVHYLNFFFCFQVCWNTDQTSWAEMVVVLSVNFCVVSKRANRELDLTHQLETLPIIASISILQQPVHTPKWSTSSQVPAPPQLVSCPVIQFHQQAATPPLAKPTTAPLSLVALSLQLSRQSFSCFFYSIPIILGQRFLDHLILTPDYNLPRTFQRAWTRKHQMVNWFVLVWTKNQPWLCKWW